MNQLTFPTDWATGLRGPRLGSARVIRKKSRAEVKAQGGLAYEDLLARERAARAKFRKEHPGYWRDAKKDHWAKRGRPYKTMLCASARARGRKKGLESTIQPDDLAWPTHCPVLGIELAYPAGGRHRRHTSISQGNWPSLDRWDNSKGYIPGNVFVISMRANGLKNNATAQELRRLADYAENGPCPTI